LCFRAKEVPLAPRILLVEDNPTNLELMSYLLQAFGYDHLIARDGVEALEMARVQRPDLIICDIQLPRLDGYGVVKTLKGEAPFRSTPMVAVTALAMVGDRDKVLASGFNGYIAKPIQPETFVAQVERFLLPEQKSGTRLTQTPADAVIPEPRAHGRGTVLVVDDTADNISLARSILQPFGYQVIAAESVQCGYDEFRRASPDLVLCDVHLGLGNGFELLELIRNNHSNCEKPFILISSSAPTIAERQRAAARDVILLIRPIEADQLLREIEKRMSKSAQQSRMQDDGDDPNSG
jgi:two-component system cell cycle response regulator